MSELINTSRKKLNFKNATDTSIKLTDNKELIDLTSGWNVTNIGWNNQHVHSELVKFIDTQSAYSPAWLGHKAVNQFHDLINEQLNEKYDLLKCSTGSESVEAAIKLARRITKRTMCLGFKNVYHGWTMGASMIGGIHKNYDFELNPNEFKHLEFPDDIMGNEIKCLDSLLEILENDIPAAIIIEPIFTNPGGFSLSDNFIQELASLCSKNSIILICDEVGTGFGRTGYFFGFEHFKSLQPDIICLSKAITNGTIPMACTLVKTSILKDKSIPFTGLFNTYGCIPIACNTAISTSNYIIDNQLVKRSRELGEKGLTFLIERFSKSNKVHIKGRGLYLSIIITNEDCTEYLSFSEIQIIKNELYEKGLFIESSDYCNALLIMPPLTISENTFLGALEIISNVVINFTKG